VLPQIISEENRVQLHIIEEPEFQSETEGTAIKFNSLVEVINIHVYE